MSAHWHWKDEAVLENAAALALQRLDGNPDDLRALFLADLTASLLPIVTRNLLAASRRYRSLAHAMGEAAFNAHLRAAGMDAFLLTLAVEWRDRHVDIRTALGERYERLTFSVAA